MVRVLDEVDSTNSYVRKRVGELEDGVLVVARRQTAGRGRRGRVWVSPPGVNFTGSVLFKRLADGFHAGCLLGVAALASLRELAPGLPVYLKWPNDLYVEDRKLAGLLCESVGIEGGRITAVVAGIGINVNLPEEALRAIDQPATSLLAETGKAFDLDVVSERLDAHLAEYYRLYLRDPAVVIREWIAANLLVGERLTVIDPRGEAHSGLFRELREDGGMVLDEGGTPYLFTCGDVKIDRGSVDWSRVNRKALERISGSL